ncbi:hypothetical protein SAMN05519104_2354 [Rhizobiales bacterium GAS188]|nr:hypothetical protein SAMN05519104_2354 [Rhizobiales bacterium GAS188]
MAWLKAGIGTTIITAVLMVAALVVISVLQKGVEPMSLFTLILVGLPAGLVAAAPIGLVVLPLAAVLIDQPGARLFRNMALTGAVAGALLPLIIMFGFKIRPPGMVGTISGLLVIGGVVAGTLAGLFFAEILQRVERR